MNRPDAADLLPIITLCTTSFPFFPSFPCSSSQRICFFPYITLSPDIAVSSVSGMGRYQHSRRTYCEKIPCLEYQRHGSQPGVHLHIEDNDITTPIFFQLHNRQKLVTLQKYHHCQKLPVLKIHRPSKLKGAIQ